MLQKLYIKHMEQFHTLWNFKNRKIWNSSILGSHSTGFMVNLCYPKKRGTLSGDDTYRTHVTT